jgi:hypothetical protein
MKRSWREQDKADGNRDDGTQDKRGGDWSGNRRGNGEGNGEGNRPGNGLDKRARHAAGGTPLTGPDAASRPARTIG